MNYIMTYAWRVDIFMRYDNKGGFLALPAESKLLLVSLIDRDGEKCFCWGMEPGRTTLDIMCTKTL